MRRLTITIFSILVGSCSFAQHADSLFTREQIQSDLKILNTAIVEAHPSYGRFSSTVHFDSIFNAIYTHLPEKVSLHSFYKEANALVASLQCGHTKFHPGFQYFKSYPFFFNDTTVLPLVVDIRNRKVTIINSQNNEIPVGAEIMEINNQPIDSILTILYRAQFADGNVQSSKEREVSAEFSARYSNLIESSKNYQITYRYNNTIIAKTLNGINYATWVMLGTSVSKLLKAENKLSFFQDSIAYLRIADFASGKRLVMRFIDSVFSNISSRKASHLIIDVRENQGGYDKLGAYLFSKIALKDFNYYDRIEVKAKSKRQFTFSRYASFPSFSGLFPLFIKEDGNNYSWRRHDNLGNQKPAKKNYTGQVYFLMDGLSYSTTAEFLAIAKSEGRGFLLGEEAGGAYAGNNSGIFTFVTLPTTKMLLAIPLGGYYMAVKPIQDLSRGILPTYPVEITSHDLLNKRDVVLEETLNYIGQYSKNNSNKN